MSRREPGELVSITYTSTGGEVAGGDYLRTTTGRTYLVETVRPHRTRRLTYAIKAIVMPEDFEVDDEHDVVHPLHWNRRGRRR